jgi:hydroxyacylglutathione hydrolase
LATNLVTVNLGFVNAYLLKVSEGFVLIDTGMPGQWDALQEALKSSGCYPGLLKLVILTHADRDHSGNCLRLKQTYKTPIAAHPLDSAALQSGVPPQRVIRTLSGKLLFGLIGLLRRFGRGPGGLQTFTPDVLLEDGQSLAGYGLEARVVHLPGHTKGSIGVLTEEGEFFAGDFCVNRRKPGLSPYVENFDEYRNSIEKAKRLAGSIKTVYPGHGMRFPADRLSALSF